MHWYLIMYKAILGVFSSYLCCLIKQKAVEKYFLRSQNYYTLSVPFVRSELGKKAFIYAAPSAVFGSFQKSYSANENRLNDM